MKKSQLKEKRSYYYEEKAWYESCPDTLPKVPEFKTEIFPRAMTHQEILDTYKIIPYSSYAEAAAVVVSIIPDLKWPSRIVYFKENEVLYRFDAWRDDDGQLGVNVGRVHLGREYAAEYGVAFSNSPSDTLDSLSSLDSLELSRAIEICKSNGLVVYKPL